MSHTVSLNDCVTRGYLQFIDSLVLLHEADYQVLDAEVSGFCGLLQLPELRPLSGPFPDFSHPQRQALIAQRLELVSVETEVR